MATLDEILALLPDNSVGAISAADMRAVVTALYENDSLLLARVDEVQGEIEPNTIAVTGLWRTNVTAGAVPGPGGITCNTGVFATASWLRMASVDRDSVDMEQVLLQGVEIYVQQRTNSYNFVRYNPTGPALDKGNYVEVPVEVVQSLGALPDAQEVSVIHELPTAIAATVQLPPVWR